MLDDRLEGQWVSQHLLGSVVASPHVMPFECANVIRRQERRGAISQDQAAQAHADLIGMPLELWDYHLHGARAWSLHANLTIYDASYVSLAEFLDGPLLTLDESLGRAPRQMRGVDATARVNS